MNSVIKYLVVSFIILPALFSCTAQKRIEGNGLLKGKITIGPLCPVETNPPSPQCLPTKETYKTWAIDVWTLNKTKKVVTLDPQLDGTYQTDLPVGEYTVDYDVTKTNRIGRSNLPALIHIILADTTKLNIDIDTGIR